MKVSKYLFAATVALFAGNCDVVEGSTLPVDGQQLQVNAAPAIAPVSDEFLQRLEKLKRLEELKSSLYIPDGESDEEEETEEVEYTSHIISDMLGILFPGVDQNALYRDLELSRNPQAKLAIAFGMREHGIDVIGMYDEIMGAYQLAMEHAQGNPDISIDEDVFNICVLLSLNIDEDIILAADASVRWEVAQWFTGQDEATNESDFGCFYQWKASLEEGDAQLMMHALDRSPRLGSVLFAGDCGNPNAVNDILWKLSERCSRTLMEVKFREEGALTLSNASFRTIEPGLSALLHGNEALSSLIFENLPIGDYEFASIMQEAKTCPSLTDLDFSGCKMTDAGIARISEELGRPGCKIERLHFSCKHISDSGFLRLARGIVANGFIHGDLYSVIVGSGHDSISLQVQEALTAALYLNPRMCILGTECVDPWCELDRVDRLDDDGPSIHPVIIADFSELQDDDALIKEAQRLGLIRGSEEEAKARSILESHRRAEVTRTAEAAAEEVQSPAEKKSKANEDDQRTTNE